MTFDPRPYIEGLLAANRAEKERITVRAKEAVSEAHTVARKIIEHDPDVKRVLLFGSLAKGEPARLDFDIDIALDGGDTYRAMDITEESEFVIDVVRLDLVPQHVRDRILRTGIPLAERDSEPG